MSFKVLLLAPGNVIHSQRWANGLVEAGIDVLFASQHAFLPGGWDSRVRHARLPFGGPMGYFANAPALARLHMRTGCDILNAHYATGYGTLAAVSRIRPRLVSVWGSDVYDFPEASPLHRTLLQTTLSRADAIGSTSEAMAEHVKRLLGASWSKPIFVTPFGVDTSRFSPRSRRLGGPLVFGTVKTLAPKYGIDTLLLAFQILVQGGTHGDSRLRIYGDGPQRAGLAALATRLGLSDHVEWMGAIPHAAVPGALHGLDVFVAASRLDSESFGVAVVEASASGLPVIVTRVGGLPEVVEEGVTGLVVQKESPGALADAMQRLASDPGLRSRMGEAGRERVVNRYEWRANVKTMVDLYRQVQANGSALA